MRPQKSPRLIVFLVAMAIAAALPTLLRPALASARKARRETSGQELPRPREFRFQQAKPEFPCCHVVDDLTWFQLTRKQVMEEDKNAFRCDVCGRAKSIPRDGQEDASFPWEDPTTAAGAAFPAKRPTDASPPELPMAPDPTLDPSADDPGAGPPFQ